jgi:hypothetical protein
VILEIGKNMAFNKSYPSDYYDVIIADSFPKTNFSAFLVLDANIMAKDFLKENLMLLSLMIYCGSRPSNCKKHKLGNTHAIRRN